MSRTQIQQTVVVLLLIAFVILGSVSRNSFRSLPTVFPAAAPRAPLPDETPHPPGEAPAPPEVSRDVFLPPGLLQERIKQREIKRLEKKLKPPAPDSAQAGVPVKVEIDVSRFQVQGIFWGVANPQAIINRKIVSVGEEIDGAKIVSISKDRILIRGDSAEAELKPPAVQKSRSERGVP